MMAPAALRRVIATASEDAMLSLKRRSPQVDGSPVMSKLSFAVIGTPSKGPTGFPAFRRRSAAAAAFLARAISVTTTAFSAPLCLPYWERQSASRADAVILPVRSRRASSVAERKCKGRLGIGTPVSQAKLAPHVRTAIPHADGGLPPV